MQINDSRPSGTTISQIQHKIRWQPVDPAINQQYCIPVGNVASREASSIRSDAKIINNELGQEAGVDIDIDDDDDDSSSEEEEEIEEVRQRSWRT